VIRIGGGKKSKGKAADGAGVGESRAKMMERKKREAVIFGSKGSSASTDDQSKTEDIPKREARLFAPLFILPSPCLVHILTSPVLLLPLCVEQLLILPSHLTTALTTSRPSVPAAERIRLSKIYGAFVNERSKGEARLKGADEGMGEGVGSRASLGWSSTDDWMDDQLSRVDVVLREIHKEERFSRVVFVEQSSTFLFETPEPEPHRASPTPPPLNVLPCSPSLPPAPPSIDVTIIDELLPHQQ
jgi:hypothetical protein